MDEHRVDDFARSIYESLRTLIFDDSAEFNYPLDHQYKYIDDVNLYRTQLRRYSRQLIRYQRKEKFLERYITVLLGAMEREEAPSEDIIYASLQSFFVVEVILKCTGYDLIKKDDPIFLGGETLEKAIVNILMHTALPFKYLEAAFILTVGEIYPYVVATFMTKELRLGGPIFGGDIDDLYDRIRYREQSGTSIRIDNDDPNVEPKHLLAFVHKMWVTPSRFGKMAMSKEPLKRKGRQQVIQNATELQRAGIRFKGVKKSTFDIRFQRDLLEIPILSIITETCSFLQNCIAYEKKHPEEAMLVVSDYCVTMGCLIQSPQDVQLLRESGVIENYLHDNEEVVAVFDKLGKRVPPSTHFCYSDLFDEVNKHCVSWKAKVSRNYFKVDNQLEVVSFLFALYIILPVTILQTVYTVISYYKGGG